MKNIFGLILLLLASVLNAQKVYQFDYALEFEAISYKEQTNKVRKFYHFINSKNNKIYLSYHRSFVGSFHAQFHDFDGYVMHEKVDSVTFMMSNELFFNCNHFEKMKSNKRYFKKLYKFENLNDTLINGKEYHHYVYKAAKKSSFYYRNKRKEFHFVVHKNQPNFLPYLYFSNAYLTWNHHKCIPNGSLYLLYIKDEKGEIEYKARVRQIIEIDKKLILPDDCQLSYH